MSGPHFHGKTYEPKHDQERLSRQVDRVQALMEDSRRRTLAEISEATGDPEASVSARIRGLREELGEHRVPLPRRRGGQKRGQWEYRLLPPGPDPDNAPKPKPEKIRATKAKRTAWLDGLRKLMADHDNVPASVRELERWLVQNLGVKSTPVVPDDLSDTEFFDAAIFGGE